MLPLNPTPCGIHDGEELEVVVRPRPRVPAGRAVASGGVCGLTEEEDRPRPFVPAGRAVAGVFTLLLPLVAVFRAFTFNQLGRLILEKVGAPLR